MTRYSVIAKRFAFGVIIAVPMYIGTPGCAAGRQKMTMTPVPSTQPSSSEAVAQQVTGQLAAAIGKLIEVGSAKIGAVIAEYRKQDNRQIVNELWPWVARSIAIAAILAVAVTIVLVVYIRRNSYKVQKPEYEQAKKGSADVPSAIAAAANAGKMPALPALPARDTLHEVRA